jgi:hypothetical protein
MDTYTSNDFEFIEELKEHIKNNPLNLNDLIFNPEFSREEALKRNSEIVECDRCGVKGNYPNMMRWHFTKCQVVLRTCKYCGLTIPRQNVKEYLYKNKHYCNRKCYMYSKRGKPCIEMTQEIKDKLSLAKKLHYVRLKSNQTK